MSARASLQAASGGLRPGDLDLSDARTFLARPPRRLSSHFISGIERSPLNPT